MTKPSPADLLKPDARMTKVLSGQLGFSPPTFAGEVGFAVSDSIRVLALRSQQTVLIVSGAPAGSAPRIAAAVGLPANAVRVSDPTTANESVESVARTAIAGLRSARVEWTDAFLPSGGWSQMSTIWVARIVDENDEVQGTLLITGEGVSGERAATIVTEATGSPTIVMAGAGTDSEADSRGRALGHAGLAALAELPPAGKELYLERVVESGAPLAVWRPRDAQERGEPGIKVDDESWQLGPVRIRFDPNGVIEVSLPTGPYTR